MLVGSEGAAAGPAAPKRTSVTDAPEEPVEGEQAEPHRGDGQDEKLRVVAGDLEIAPQLFQRKLGV
jgi:hypothetical protein